MSTTLLRRLAPLFVTSVLVFGGCLDLFSGALNNQDESRGLEGAGIGGSCEGDRDCRLNLLCVQSRCEPQGNQGANGRCFTTLECGDGLFCDATVGVCRAAGAGAESEGCTLTNDCRAGLICAPRGLALVCQPAGTGDVGDACTSSADCYAGLGCNTSQANASEGLRCRAGAGAIPLPYAGVTCDPLTQGSVRALFELSEDFPGDDFYRLPFPNDIRLTDGRPDLSEHPAPGLSWLGFDLVGNYIDAVMERQQGFGLNHDVYFRFSNEIDLSTLRAGDDATIRYVSVTPESPEYNRQRGLRWSGSTGRGRYICANHVSIRRPWEQPLRANETYVVLLTRGVTAVDGSPVERSEDFEAMLASNRPSGPVGAAWDRYQPLRDWIDEGHADADEILVATVFTTGDPYAVHRELRAASTATAPTNEAFVTCDTGVASPCEDGQHEGGPSRTCAARSDSFAELHTRVSLPIFQQGEPPYLQEGGFFALDGVVPVEQRREDVCVSMSVPSATAPSQGWPVVIYAHGTGGSFRSNINDVAGMLSRIGTDSGTVGFVTIGWDQVQHGTRRGDSDLDPEQLVYNFIHPEAAWGNFMQGAADLHALVDWVETLEIPASQSPSGEPIRLDPNRIYFFGHSQGGTTGPLAVPYNPAIRAAFLSGAGGGLVLGLLGKKEPVDSLLAVQAGLLDPDAGEGHPVLSLIQGFFDPVDPLNIAAVMGAEEVEGVTTRRHVFHAYGVQDSYTPETALTAMARALGARYLGTIPEGVATIPTTDAADVEAVFEAAGDGFVRTGRVYVPSGYDGHFVSFRNPQANTDIRAFFAQAALRAGVEEELEDPEEPHDPEDEDPEDGDPEDGDPEDGDPEDGDPEDGDPAE